MFCDSCHKEKEENLFLRKDSTQCCSCIYSEKMKKKVVKRKKCRECGNLFDCETIKKYCSKQCSSAAYKKNSNDFWTKRLQKYQFMDQNTFGDKFIYSGVVEESY